MPIIPYSRQTITEEDINSVVEVLRSSMLTQGEVVPTFENTVAKYVNSNFGVAVNSATSGLHIACLSMDLGPGDWLWTSSTTFVASANCALYCKAKIDFVDIELSTGLLCITKLEEKLKKQESDFMNAQH